MGGGLASFSCIGAIAPLVSQISVWAGIIWHRQIRQMIGVVLQALLMAFVAKQAPEHCLVHFNERSRFTGRYRVRKLYAGAMQ